jgi:hypothetical protein
MLIPGYIQPRVRLKPAPSARDAYPYSVGFIPDAHD